jgi:hypothetical protein
MYIAWSKDLEAVVAGLLEPWESPPYGVLPPTSVPDTLMDKPTGVNALRYSDLFCHDGVRYHLRFYAVIVRRQWKATRRDWY